MNKDVNPPIVTIIVPVYNVEAELNRCVESLVSQTFSDLQIILVDDGSTDLSGTLCDSWAVRDPVSALYISRTAVCLQQEMSVLMLPMVNFLVLLTATTILSLICTKRSWPVWSKEKFL